MTEAEWLDAGDPEPMLEHLAGLGHGRSKLGKRLLRLFSCACCRRIWRLLDQECLATVEAGERSAEGVYEDRVLPAGHLDPVRLSILADALTDLGCGEEVVSHLRTEGPHVRGCWAVDLILAKT